MRAANSAARNKTANPNMRTATTVATTHDGKDVLVSGPSVPIQKQLADFRALKSLRSHDEFAVVHYQERDGHVLTYRLMSPDKLKAHDEQRAKDSAARVAFVEGKEKAKTDGISAAEEARLKEHKAIVDAHSKNIETIKATLAGDSLARADIAEKKSPKTK